ncbi:MAG TPA: erythrose-4-phosphate dehydrogenase, partial [Azospira sp.]|nr:erythrose-4-phosphate dehydrogenase [Azospira sp.]
DLVVTLSRDGDAAAINELLRQASQGPWQGVLTTSAAPHASIDFNHDPHSAIVDTSQTRAAGPRLINLFIWFDNEWGFANRMLDVARCWQRRW